VAGSGPGDAQNDTAALLGILNSFEVGPQRPCSVQTQQAALRTVRVIVIMLCTCCTAKCRAQLFKPVNYLHGACAQSAKEGLAYTKSWTGEVCQNQSNEGSPWGGIKCEGGRVTFVQLRGGASGSLDGFGQLTALSKLDLDNNSFTGKPHSMLPQHTLAAG
jgi:hypothetical protein